VSDQTAIGLTTLIVACFWAVVSADAMTAPPRRLRGPAWPWLISAAQSPLSHDGFPAQLSKRQPTSATGEAPLLKPAHRVS
jgi:hypothetical protein